MHLTKQILRTETMVIKCLQICIKQVNSVRLPRHVADKRLFSGTALVELSSEEDATKLLEQSITYAGMELELKMKKDFDTERAKLEEDFEISRPQSGSKRNEKSTADDYPKGLILGFKLKKISAADASEQNGKHEEVDGAVVSVSGEMPQVASEPTEEKMSEVRKVEETDKDNINGNDEPKVGVVTEVLESHGTEESLVTPADKEVPSSKEGVSNAAMHKDDMDVVLREDLKSIFQKFGTVKFIDFTMRAESGFIRFEDAEASQKARAAAVLSEEGGLIVKNFVATLDPVTGDAEKEYWGKLRSNQDNHRQNFRGNRGGGRGGGRHNNRGGWNKHSRSRDNDSASHPNKAQKVEVA